jgi:hypothetical protein
MRIYWPSDVVVDEEKSGILVVSSKQWERSRICKVPQARALLPHRGLADAISPDQIFANTNVARIVAQRWRHDGKFKTALAIERNVPG